MYPKVGLALGSGSARGLAHIGVLEVFERNGIPVDAISGSSMGALIGSIYSCGTNLNLLSRYMINLKQKKIFDITVKKGGLIRGEKVQEIVKAFTKNKNFSETLIPFLCVAVDVETGELIVFNEGKIHEAVRASVSIPGIFMPYKLNGRLLVDGGVLDRVPCKPLKDYGVDTIIGVDVGYRGGEERKVKSTIQAIQSSIDIMQWEITKTRQQSADILLSPNVRRFNSMSLSHAAECIEEGRNCAREALPQIKSLLMKRGIPLLTQR